MSQFAMVKLVVDIGLGACLLYLAIRFLRGGISERQASQLASLDASLKALIREAEISGNNLNDQLLRRQQSMEGSLREIESTDGKLQRSLAAAKDLSTTLDEQLKKVREDLLDVERRRVRMESARENALVREPVRESPREVAVATPSRFEAAPAAAITAEIIEDGDVPSPQFTRVNIYGESIPESSVQEVIAAPKTVQSALRQAMEKIVESKRASNALSKPALDAVYAAAEEMLKTGRNLEAVAARTKLPLEEVRTLSQKVIRDTILQDTPASAPAASETVDQRLGVLGNTRRTEQVV